MTNRIKVVTSEELKQTIQGLYPNLSNDDIGVVRENEESQKINTITVGSIDEFRKKVKSQLENLNEQNVGVSKKEDFSIQTSTGKELADLVKDLGINLNDVTVVTASELHNSSENDVKKDTKATNVNKIR